MQAETPKIFAYQPHHFPKLNDKDGDMQQRWEIRFYIFDEEAGKPTLVRNSEMNRVKNKKERYKVAKKLMREFKEMMLSGIVKNPKKAEAKEEAPKINLYTLLEDVVDYKTKTLTARPKWYITFKNKMKELFEDMPLQNFSSKKAHEFLDKIVQEGKSNKSYNHYLMTAMACFNYAVERKYISENPFKGVKKLVVELGKKNIPFTKNQRTEIHAECQELDVPWLSLMLDFIYYAFARISELKKMQISDLQDKMIRFRAENAKNRKQQFVEIPKALEAKIQEAKLRSYPEDYYVFGKEGTPSKFAMSESYQYWYWAKIIKKLDLPGHSMYAMKHTGVIELYKNIQSTQELDVIRKQCRHSSFKETETYLANLGLIVENAGVLDRME